MTPADNGPVYVILGASGGIGQVLTRHLARGGARLALGARDPGRLQALADSLPRPGGETSALAQALDAGVFAEVQGLIQTAKETYGRVDGVVNLVGSILLKPAHLLSPEEFEETLRTNLTTAFNALKAGVDAMRTNKDPAGGSVVLMSSVAAKLGLANHEAIAAAKAGVVGLVQAGAASYAPRGIRVNALAPGLVRTPLAGRLLASEEAEKASAKMHALGRVGEPEDLVEAIAYLLDGSKSGWTTGQTLSVDGGFANVRGRG